VFLDVGDSNAVDARSHCSAIARDPVERHDQRRRVVHKVEQVVEPAAGIGRRPTVKLGLHLKIPAEKVPQGPTLTWRHRSVAHLPALQYPPFSKPLPPFAMWPAFPGLGLLRRLRPTRHVRRSMRLSRPGELATRQVGSRDRRFPCSL